MLAVPAALQLQLHLGCCTAMAPVRAVAPTPHLPPPPPQVARMVVSGERPAIPPARLLPGPGAREFAGLDDYCRLTRWAGAWAGRLVGTRL